MLTIRRMGPSDIPFAIRLTDQEHWDISRQDLERILTLDPHGSFVAALNSNRVGLTTTTNYGKTLGWIGNVIVDRQHRGEHIGPRLVERAVLHLLAKGVRNIALYTFDENLDFYEGLGFVKDVPFLRLKRKPGAPILPYPTQNTSPSLKRILTVDKIAFGADRSRLIRRVLRERIAYVVGRSTGISRTSYLLVKNYDDMCEFGPWVNLGPMRETAAILKEALIRTGKKPAEISVLATNLNSLALLKTAGFRRIRSGYRMYFTRRRQIGKDGAQLALGFLDKG